jgi:hypothetical protein
MGDADRFGTPGDGPRLPGEMTRIDLRGFYEVDSRHLDSETTDAATAAAAAATA